MKKILSLLCVILTVCLMFSFAGCGKTEPQTQTTQFADATSTEHTKVKFTVKNFGTFIIELYPEYAPETVANFINLVNNGIYSNTIFHRVVDNFMAQGGQVSNVNLTPIKGEFLSNGFSQNTLKHERGVVSMARATDKNSATSQFFICYKAVSSLDGNYAAFGKVIEGMETIDKFTKVERTLNSLGETAIPVKILLLKKQK